MLCVLAVRYLTQKSLIAELRLDLALFLPNGALVKEPVCLLLQGLDVVLIEELRAVQLLDQLLVDAGLARRPLTAELHVDEVKDAILEHLFLGLSLVVGLWTVVRIVEMAVNLLANAQVFRLFVLV